MLMTLNRKALINRFEGKIKELVEEAKETTDPYMLRQIMDQITEYRVTIWNYQKAEIKE